MTDSIQGYKNLGQVSQVSCKWAERRHCVILLAKFSKIIADIYECLEGRCYNILTLLVKP